MDFLAIFRKKSQQRDIDRTHARSAVLAGTATESDIDALAAAGDGEAELARILAIRERIKALRPQAERYKSLCRQLPRAQDDLAKVIAELPNNVSAIHEKHVAASMQLLELQRDIDASKRAEREIALREREVSGIVPDFDGSYLVCLADGSGAGDDQPEPVLIVTEAEWQRQNARRSLVLAAASAREIDAHRKRVEQWADRIQIARDKAAPRDWRGRLSDALKPEKPTEDAPVLKLPEWFSLVHSGDELLRMSPAQVRAVVREYGGREDYNPVTAW